MGGHALLSASASNIWMNCHPSAQYGLQFPEPKGTPHSEEGTFAHAVAEAEIAAYLGLETKPLPTELMRYDSPELRAHVAVYVRYAIELIVKVRRSDPDAIVLLERRVNYSRWVQEGYGTCDLVIVIRGIVYVVDLKFGRGLRVEANTNSQLRLYGAGAVEMFAHLYDITEVVMTIVQPRLGHIDTEVLSKQALYDWMEQVVAPAAALAWNGQGEFVPGEHCRWCKGKAVCAARAQKNLDLARLDFAPPQTLDETAIAHVLEQASQLYAWVRDVESYALNQALQGRHFAGYKLVAGRYTRKISDTSKAAAALLSAGIDAGVVYAPRELNSLTALETAVGKKKFAHILGDLIAQSPGKPVLVPVEDKRPEFTPVANAAADFEIHLTKENHHA